jgi:hypothetical protein
LRALGWRLKYQTFLQGREPDYALFLDEGSLQASIDASVKKIDLKPNPFLKKPAESAPKKPQ